MQPPAPAASGAVPPAATGGPPSIAVGGLGGSGTRVFAAALQAAGVDIGDRLNAPLDNLWFTVLFKRAAWTRAHPAPEDVARATGLFLRAMTTGLYGSLTPAEAALLDQLRADLSPGGHWQCGARAADAQSLIDSLPRPGDPARPRGWKEPNTHVFLPALNRLVPGLRYIHVLRDGLDMAFSRNAWQARHWGHLYDLPRDPGTPLPLRQLRYWVAANRAALDYGARQMPGRFLAVRYEAFCADPARHWDRIRRFLELPADRPLPTGLVQPTTIGRKHGHDLSFLPPDLLEAARALQSDIEKTHGVA